MDLISVIIPYFKKKKFIFDTIYSVLHQSYNNIEILIIYDDEDKEDLKFLNDNFKKFPNIKILINDENIGAGPSRNKGVHIAKGKYIGFIDADDIWKKDKLLKQIEFMKKNSYKISHTTYEIIDENGKFLGLRKANHFYNYQDILKSCDIGLSSIILEKELLNNDTKFADLKTKEDFVLWLKILYSEVEIAALRENLMSWRKTRNSLSSSLFQKLMDGYKVYRNYMKYNAMKSLYLLICLSINYLKKND